MTEKEISRSLEIIQRNCDTLQIHIGILAFSSSNVINHNHTEKKIKHLKNGSFTVENYPNLPPQIDVTSVVITIDISGVFGSDLKTALK